MAFRIIAYILLVSFFLAGCNGEKPSKTKLLDFDLFTIEVPNGWHKVDLDSSHFFVGGILDKYGESIKFYYYIDWDRSLDLNDSGMLINNENRSFFDRELFNKKKNRVIVPRIQGQDRSVGVIFDSVIVGSGAEMSLIFRGANLSPQKKLLFKKAIKSISFNPYLFKPHSVIKEKVAKFVSNCDSVFIFQVGPTKEFGMKMIRDYDTTKSYRPDSFPSNQPIYRNGRFNWELPKKMVKLNREQRNSLVDILLSNAQNGFVKSPRCSDYLHMVAFFYGSKTNYLALNFCNEACRASPEWGTNLPIFDEEKWERMRTFFKDCGIDPNEVLGRGPEITSNEGLIDFHFKAVSVHFNQKIARLIKTTLF